jgi:hypothetical protein
MLSKKKLGTTAPEAPTPLPVHPTFGKLGSMKCEQCGQIMHSHAEHTHIVPHPWVAPPVEEHVAPVEKTDPGKDDPIEEMEKEMAAATATIASGKAGKTLKKPSAAVTAGAKTAILKKPSAAVTALKILSNGEPCMKDVFAKLKLDYETKMNGLSRNVMASRAYDSAKRRCRAAKLGAAASKAFMKKMYTNASAQYDKLSGEA